MPGPITVTDAAELAGVNAGIIERARAAAGEAADGYALTLDQPVYVAVMTDAESGALRRTFYEAWTTRASDQAPGAGNGTTRRSWTTSCGCATSWRSCSISPATPTTRWRRAWRKSTVEVFGLPRAAAAGEPRGRRTGTARTRRLCRPAARRLGPELLVRAAAAERYTSRRRSCDPTFRCRACSRDCSTSRERLFGVRIEERTGVPVWHPDARYFEIQNAAGAPVGSFYLDPAPAPTSAAAPGWMNASAARA